MRPQANASTSLRRFRRAAAGVAAALAMAAGLAAAPALAAPPVDPLGSPMWTYRVEEWLGKDAVVRFDPRLKLVVPEIAEDQRAFPVLVDARALPDARRIMILVDLNPIPVPLDFELDGAQAFVATRIKLDQRTPVRALAQLADGSWVAAGTWVDAAGGGCSLPPVSRARGDWAHGLGEAQARAWALADGSARLRVHLRHPMDTGFIENVPLYHIEQIVLRGPDGAALGRLRLWASIAEDPVLTLMTQPQHAGAPLAVEAADTSGIRYAASAPVEPAPALAASARAPSLLQRVTFAGQQ